MNFSLSRLGFTAIATLALASVASAHDHHQPRPADKPNALTVLELEVARRASARFNDVEEAVKAGYVDIGLFMPNMGWHYRKLELVDGKFDIDEPELLVYADDPCGGPRHLVAVEYAVPLELSKRAPRGFNGGSDMWDANQTFQLWTLHAWIWEYNPDGVFAAHNPRVQ